MLWGHVGPCSATDETTERNSIFAEHRDGQNHAFQTPSPGARHSLAWFARRLPNKAHLDYLANHLSPGARKNCCPLSALVHTPLLLLGLMPPRCSGSTTCIVGACPEPPSPAARRPSPPTSPYLADGTRPQRGHRQLPGEPERRAHRGRAWWDGVWEKHEAERREGKAPDEAGGPEPRRTGCLFSDRAASATCRLPPRQLLDEARGQKLWGPTRQASL